MIGIIIPAVKGIVPPFDPDEAFDPTTHIASEEAFISLLDHGVYDEKYIGYMVTLSNSVAYDDGVWVIADVNHDSANTGQTDCYDLISRDCFGSSVFDSAKKSIWRSCSLRTWMNGTYYNGFSSNFKERMMNPKYYSSNEWYNDDKVLLPSFREVTTQYDDIAPSEGTTYPIFTSSSSRIKTYGNVAQYWWTRTRYSSNVSIVYTSGDMTNYSPKYECYLAPIIRVQ